MDREAERFKVLEMVRGHDDELLHEFNHRGGKCPQCGCIQHRLMYCNPVSPEHRQGYVRGCEIQMPHIHHICRACNYLWVEHTMDNAIARMKRGEIVVQTEVEAALCILVLSGAAQESFDADMMREIVGKKSIVAVKDELGNMTLTAIDAPDQGGKPHLVKPPDDEGEGTA